MSTTDSRPEPCRKRRRFQFGLRTLLVLMLLVSVGLSWCATKLCAARRQGKAVAAITSLGGYVEYDDEFDRSGDLPGYRDPSGPAWVRTLLGRDVVSEAFAVDLERAPISDVELEHVKALRRLEWLSLRGTRITDDGLVQLKEMSELRLLNLHGTQVTDAGIGSLAGLPQLRLLDLQNTRVTDEGVKRLRQALPNCAIVR